MAIINQVYGIATSLIVILVAYLIVKKKSQGGIKQYDTIKYPEDNEGNEGETKEEFTTPDFTRGNTGSERTIGGVRSSGELPNLEPHRAGTSGTQDAVIDTTGDERLEEPRSIPSSHVDEAGQRLSEHEQPWRKVSWD